MVYTIAQMRSTAQLNMAPECYKIYLALIEPGIEQMLKEYFRGWQNIELCLSLAVMRHFGVFKGTTAFSEVDEEDLAEYADQIDVVKYRRIQGMSVYALIEYLADEGILGAITKELFHLLRKKRNSIHKQDGILTEQDRMDFEWASGIAWYIFLGLSDTNLFATRELMKTTLEGSSSFLMTAIKSRNNPI